MGRSTPIGCASANQEDFPIVAQKWDIQPLHTESQQTVTVTVTVAPKSATGNQQESLANPPTCQEGTESKSAVKQKSRIPTPKKFRKPSSVQGNEMKDAATNPLETQSPSGLEIKHLCNSSKSSSHPESPSEESAKSPQKHTKQQTSKKQSKIPVQCPNFKGPIPSTSTNQNTETNTSVRDPEMSPTKHNQDGRPFSSFPQNATHDQTTVRAVTQQNGSKCRSTLDDVTEDTADENSPMVKVNHGLLDSRANVTVLKYPTFQQQSSSLCKNFHKQETDIRKTSGKTSKVGGKALLSFFTFPTQRISLTNNPRQKFQRVNMLIRLRVSNLF